MSKVFAPILLVIISLGLFFSYLSPALGALKKYQELTATLAEAITNYEMLFEKKKEVMETKQGTLQAHENNFQQILPDEIDTVQLIIDIENMLADLNLTALSYTLPSQATYLGQKEGYDVNTVQSKVMSIELTGPYEDFKQFIQTLESSRTLIDVTSIGIEKKVNEGTEGYTLLYEVYLQLYWLS